jgi:hypothetical protein
VASKQFLLPLLTRTIGNISRHIIDGEIGHLFEIIAQKTTSSNRFPDMEINFDILYDDEVFHFKAVKTADLDSADLERTGSLEQEWNNLHDPRPEVKYKLLFDRTKEEDFWPTRKRVFPENKKRKAEYACLPSFSSSLPCVIHVWKSVNIKTSQIPSIQQRFVQRQLLRIICTDHLYQVLGRPRLND